MSSGHAHREGFGLNSQTLDRLLKNEKVQEHLNAPKKIDESNDIPYLGSYSQDGKTIYFDRHLPKELKFGNFTFNPIITLRMHESLEKALIDVLGYGYEQAHKAATAYEKRGVLTFLGPNMWDQYEKKLDKYIKADEHEKLKRVPKDLDMTPYLAEPVDKKLLAHLEKFVSPDKISKEEAEYSSDRGKPNHHCGPDEGWPNGYCSMYREENRCTLVRGYIATRGGCKFWERAK